MTTPLYRALKAAGVDDDLAQEAARSVIGVDQISALSTKTDVAEVKADLAELRAASKADIAEVKADLAAMRAATKADMVELRAATKTDIAEVKIAIADLRSELLKWNIGAMAILTIIYSAINAALRFVKP
jgi:hypothetical protein